MRNVIVQYIFYNSFHFFFVIQFTLAVFTFLAYVKVTKANLTPENVTKKTQKVENLDKNDKKIKNKYFWLYIVKIIVHLCCLWYCVENYVLHYEYIHTR